MAAKIYDYIIVGAGSAGCVLADRLSRDGKSDVLLLEAGGKNDSLFVHMPRGFMKILYHPDYYWKFPIEGQHDRDPGEAWHYGKGLGGSSGLNGSWYFRGMPGDFNQWEELGAPGWNWNEIERSYREMEDYQNNDGYSQRGHGGKLKVRHYEDTSPLTQAMIEAGRQMGLPVLDDINQPGTECVGLTQMTIARDGKRSSAHRTFLRDRALRKNLDIRTRVTVQKVLFDGKRVTGVETTIDGGPRTFLGREVIVSAGVMQSPKILQLSGIGDPELLAKHGIPLVHANPEVGRNLADHMMVRVSYRLKNAWGMNREFRGLRLVQNVAQYMLSGTGPLADGPPPVSAMLSSTGDKEWPDIQIGISAFTRTTNKDATQIGSPPTEKIPGITALGFQLRPHARAVVEIRSRDASHPPIVHANWFSDDRDRKMYFDLLKATRKYMEQPALKEFIGEETVPGKAVQTEEQMMEVGKWLMTSGLHGTGSCRMGREGWGVVDERARVWGVQGLRVIDCSTSPTPISGNTNGPAMAIGWRAADLILEERDLRNSTEAA